MKPDYGPGSSWYWAVFGGGGLFIVVLAWWGVG